MRYVVRVLAIPMWLCLIGTCAAETMTVREYSARWAHYYADVYRVPRELVEAVIQAESNWDPLAVSRKGAAGLMQLMPKTAAKFGVRDLFAVPDNIRGGVAYLAFLIRLFRGDLRLVTAAYLTGESPILSRGLEYSSPEVFLYVSRVLRLYSAKRAQHLTAKLQPAAERRSNALE
jgi:soluble lytic murein transglycosylase-like protein